MKKKLYFRVNKRSEYYKHLLDYGREYKNRDEFVRNFFKKHNIDAQNYFTEFCGGNNIPAKENEKRSIFLGVEATEYQILPVAKHLNKEQNGIRYLR